MVGGESNVCRSESKIISAGCRKIDDTEKENRGVFLVKKVVEEERVSFLLRRADR